MASLRFSLPVLPRPAGGGRRAHFAYLTNEEAEVLTAIRRLGEEARAVRVEISSADARGAEKAKKEACARLECLRRQRRALEPMREEAWRRKMIALGHLEDEPLAEPRP